MTNKLYVGLKKKIELPKSGYLLIDDEVPEFGEWKRPRYFDPLKHSFNPLSGIDYKKARQLAEIFYVISPQGENTLTVRNGKRAMLKALLDAERLDEVEGDEEIEALIGDLLVSPVLKRMLCTTTNFTFKPRSTVLARVNRAELGDFDALVIGLLLMAQYPGQVVVPDFGFYGREVHAGLVREKRLIGGCNFLDELPEKLRKRMLLVDTVPAGALYDDAVLLARYAGLHPDPSREDNPYNRFIATSMR